MLYWFLLCHVWFYGSKNISMNYRTQGFPLEHGIVGRRSVLFTSNVGLMLWLIGVHFPPETTDGYQTNPFRGTWH